MHMRGVDVLVQQLGSEGYALAAALRTVLPQAKVFPSTDMRFVRSEQLYAEGIIGLSGLLALQEGRARSRDLPSAGAVGLQLTFARALRNSSSLPNFSSVGSLFGRPTRLPWLLMLEQDCPSKDLGRFHALKRRVQALYELRLANVTFDACLLAPLSVFRRPASANAHAAWGEGHWSAATLKPHDEMLASRGFRWLRRDAAFWGTAAVLFSSQGRARMTALLSQPSRRIDMQIDAEMAAFSTAGQLKLLVDMQPALCCVSTKSDIQTGNAGCTTCDMPAEGGENVTPR